MPTMRRLGPRIDDEDGGGVGRKMVDRRRRNNDQRRARRRTVFSGILVGVGVIVAIPLYLCRHMIVTVHSQQSEENGEQLLKRPTTAEPTVAFVISVYAGGKYRPEDGTLTMAPTLAVLAESVRRVAMRSRYRTSLVALVRRDLSGEPASNATNSTASTSMMRRTLEELGFKVLSVERPISIDDISEPGRTHAREMKHVWGAPMMEDNDKLLIYTLTEYDRVVLLDTDVLMLHPIDELLDDPAETLGILDYYALDEGEGGVRNSRNPNGGFALSVVPPINAGFIVARPSKATYARLIDIIRRGQFRDSGMTPDGYVKGWDDLGLGSFYGGISVQGVLPALYFREAAENYRGTEGNSTRYSSIRSYLESPTRRFREIDQCVYNVLGHPNCWGRGNGTQGTPDCRNVDCRPEANPTLQGVMAGLKVIHFTGRCREARPWAQCNRPIHKPDGTFRGRVRKRDSSQKICDLCQEFRRRWFEIGKTLLSGPNQELYSRLAPTLANCIPAVY